MSDVVEERERLRLDLETFLRAMFLIPETVVALAEQWDARHEAMMVFRVDGAYDITRRSPLEQFEAWRDGRLTDLGGQPCFR